MKTEILDYEQTVTGKVNNNEGVKGCPQLADYGLTRETLDDYLFDKQAIIDSAGSPRVQNTVSGVLIVLPVIILSAFPENTRPFGDWSFYLAVLVGLILALLVRFIVKSMVKLRLKRLYNPDIERYIQALSKHTA